MKQVVLKLALGFSLFGSIALAKEGVDLSKVETVADGFCVIDVFALEKANAKKSPNHDEKVFLKLAEVRARNIYKTRPGYDDEFGMDVKGRLVYESAGKASTPKLLGAVVRVDQDADEDLVTFYFTPSNDGSPAAKLALYDHQSAEAFWICE